MVMIYVEKVEKHVIKVCVGDGGEENASKASNEQPDIESKEHNNQKWSLLEFKCCHIMLTRNKLK